MEFKDLNLKPQLLDALKAIGFATPTPVQEKSIQPALDGNDLLVRSQTGSGKTLAYCLPIMQNLMDSDNGVQALILCPTRELAVQVLDQIKPFTKHIPSLKAVAVYGGQEISRQIVALKKKPQIVVGTPGRIMDHMRRRTLKLNGLKTIVLDEADEMLNMGFVDDIETILQTTPATRQTLMFSATYPTAIKKLTTNYQKNAVNIEIGSNNRSLENIKQTYVIVERNDKKKALLELFKVFNPKQTIIFTNTKAMSETVSNLLNENGYNSNALHGDLRQSQRQKVMNSIKSGKSNILVSSDVSARGIDINDIEYVINFDLPNNVEYFLHRIGRTARAGKKGNAVTIINTSQQLRLLKDYEIETQSKISELTLSLSASKSIKLSDKSDRKGNSRSREKRKVSFDNLRNKKRETKRPTTIKQQENGNKFSTSRFEEEKLNTRKFDRNRSSRTSDRKRDENKSFGTRKSFDRKREDRNGFENERSFSKSRERNNEGRSFSKNEDGKSFDRKKVFGDSSRNSNNFEKRNDGFKKERPFTKVENDKFSRTRKTSERPVRDGSSFEEFDNKPRKSFSRNESSRDFSNKNKSFGRDKDSSRFGRKNSDDRSFNRNSNRKDDFKNVTGGFKRDKDSSRNSRGSFKTDRDGFKKSNSGFKKFNDDKPYKSKEGFAFEKPSRPKGRIKKSRKF